MQWFHLEMHEKWEMKRVLCSERNDDVGHYGVTGGRTIGVAGGTLVTGTVGGTIGLGIGVGGSGDGGSVGGTIGVGVGIGGRRRWQRRRHNWSRCRHRRRQQRRRRNWSRWQVRHKQQLADMESIVAQAVGLLEFFDGSAGDLRDQKKRIAELDNVTWPIGSRVAWRRYRYCYGDSGRRVCRYCDNGCEGMREYHGQIGREVYAGCGGLHDDTGLA